MNSSNSEFQIRRATVADVPRLLELHYRTFDSKTNLLMLLGRPFMAAAFRWYSQDRNAFALVAEHGQALAGYVTVNRGSYYYMLKKNWAHVLVAFFLRPKLLCHQAVVQRFKSLLKPRPADGVAPRKRACLAYIAVDRENRVKGAGSALVRAALSECNTRGWSEVITAFHSSNEPARNYLSVRDSTTFRN